MIPLAPRLTRALLVLLFPLLSACAGASPEPAPSPAPQATEPAGEPEVRAADPPREEASEPRPADAEPAASVGPRAAPQRWVHMSLLAESGPTAVPGAGVDAAYELLDGRTPQREVVVAVIDGGIDIQHEDLDGVLWTNANEVPGNGVDDDDNGYVDDVHGWSFLGSPDGENVNFDTFEITRLFAACTGGAAAAGLESPGDEACVEIDQDFQEQRTEAEQLVLQIGQIEQAYPVIVNILRQTLGTEPTVETVSALASPDQQIMAARDAFLQLEAAGIDEEALAEQAESIRGRLEFGLDPEFNSRTAVGDNWLNYDDRGYGSPDVEGPDPSHGTAVSSVIAAERDNSLGLEGVANGTRIMALRAVPNGDERDKDIANAIRYAVDNGAHIINMSFGKDFSPGREAVAAAIRYADERGVLMVHAAGNDGEDLATAPNFPSRTFLDGSAANLWIEVGASAWTTVDSVAASFSNYGATQVDVFAPGQAIYAAEPDNGYGPTDGTSLAAPVVSGLAALLMAYFPDLDAAEVRTILLETATDLRSQAVVRPGDSGETVPFGDLSVTGGVVNGEAAVQRALRRPAS